jgi:hypothetical protein
MADAPTNDAAPEAESTMSQADLEALIDTELGLPTAQPDNDQLTTGGKGDDDGGNAEDNAGEESETGDEPAEAEPAGEEDAEESEPEAEEEVDDDPLNKPAPALPSDEELFIEVEDAEGVTHKISKIEDLPEDFQLKNNRQGLEIMRQLDKLEGKIEAREAERADAAAKAEQAATEQEQFTAWDKEVENLSKEKRIELGDTERINEVFGYMNEINNARREAGNPNLITSFEDALDKFEVKEAADKAEADKKNDNERAKAKASVIGRSSAAAGDNFVYRAGQYRSIDDVPVG